MSDTVLQFDDLSPKQRALFELLRREKQEKRVAILRRATAGPAPLSFAQQRLWFLDQLAPQAGIYILPIAVRLIGALDVLALKLSLDDIVRRHEAVRTTFALVDGQPVQVIVPALPLPITIVDLQTLPGDQREHHTRQLLVQDVQRSFDLTHGPLLRATLLRLGCEEHVALLTMHHIVSDGWSMDVLARELAALYAGHVSGQPATLPPLPIQYADYAVWQRAWLQGSEVGGHADTQTRRHADTEIRPSTETQSPTPNTQHPTPIQAHLAYWRAQLADLPVLELPTDYPRPAVQRYRGATYTFSLPAPLTGSLKELSHREGVTLFMTLLAAFQTLLSHYSGQEDIVVGTRIAGRARVETAGLIGFFINALVLRIDLAGNPTFQTVLRRVREICQGAYAHQGLPFERLVEELQPARDLSRNPLFQVSFVLQNAPAATVDLPGLILQPLTVPSQAATFDLDLSLVEQSGGLAGTLEYDTDLFAPDMIARFAGHYQTLLEGIVAGPERRLAELPLLSAVESQQFLVAWNATGAPFPADARLADLFVAQVARTPDAIAVVFDGPQPGVRGQGSGVRGQGDTETRRHGDRRSKIEDGGWKILHPPSSILHPQSLTYRELNERANRLAHSLRALGVQPEVVVGVCGERSPRTLIALLAILKAGGVYVPLDPAAPPAHQAAILAETQASVLLADQRLLTRFPASDLTLVPLDAPGAASAQARDDDLETPTAPDQLACILYTSGSTGRPKGIGLPQRLLLKRFAWMWRAYPFEAGEVACQRTPLTFSVSLWELLGPLLQGVSTVILSDEVVLDPAQLVVTLAAYDVSRIVVVPSLLRLILDADLDLEHRLPRLRLWSALGEPLTGELCRRFRTRLPHAMLLNQYGASEVLDVAWYDTRHLPDDALRVPIGRPIDNTQIYLLDRWLQPVPVGVPGEVYVGGASLARGYLNQPDLTAERFIPNPFAQVLGDGCWVSGVVSSNTQHPSPNTRLYKTGDLARYLPDGTLEGLGRRDHQVKVRGIRVEPGGVEAVLAQHPAVRQALVVAHADSSGDARLVAYLVISDKLQVTSSEDSSLVTRHSLLVTELRGFLRERLPSSMVPSAFMLLETLPLTSSGKVDRRALLAPERTRPEFEATYVAPETAVEEVLAGIWADLLGLEQVSIYDNFFDLGGHSLLAARMISKVGDILQVTFPVRALFEEPTIAGLSKVLLQNPEEREKIEVAAQVMLSLMRLSDDEVEMMLHKD